MTSSPIDDINSAIGSYNPFARLAIVREQDVWEQGFPDVTSLNAHASNAVFQAVEQVRNGKGKVTSLVMCAGPGVGKSHIISRIRHCFQADGSALFIYAGVEKYDLNLTNYQFLQTLADSLDHYGGSDGVTQWQELAAAMANQVWKSLRPNTEIIPTKKLVETYSSLSNSNINNNNWVDGLTSKFRQLKRSDPDVIRAIFWTLSENHSDYAVKWLSGKTISENKANTMGLPNPSIEEKYQDHEAFDTVSQVLSLISEYKPVVICFDELDTPDVRCSDTGLKRLQIIAGLIKALVDDVNLSSQSKGVVILSVMMPDTWKDKIKELPFGIVDRVLSARKEPIILDFLDINSIMQLVKLWLEDFYQNNNLKPPSPIYPFEENQLRELGTAKSSSVRGFLRWCAENFKIPGDTTKKIFLDEPVKLAFDKEILNIEKSIKKLLDNKAVIAAALRLGFSSLIGETIEKVTIERLEEVEPKSQNNGYIDFKIICKENGETVKIGVALIQQSAGNGVLAGLRRLIDYKTFKLTRGCLIRSNEISRNATQAKACLSKLLSPELGGEWVKLTGENIKPLLAIQAVYFSADYDHLKKEQILDFVKTKVAVDNYLIREILSDPSGQVPSGLIAE